MQQEDEAQRELEDEEARREQEEMDREMGSSGSPGGIDEKEQFEIDIDDDARDCIRSETLTGAIVASVGCPAIGALSSILAGVFSGGIAAGVGWVVGTACVVTVGDETVVAVNECGRKAQIEKATKCDI